MDTARAHRRRRGISGPLVGLLPALVISIFTSAPAGADPIDITFSIDPASPTVDGNITPDDVLIKGPVVHTQGRDLGLQDDFFGFFGGFDNLNALSYGVDPITNPLYFSVDRVSVGLPNSDVNRLAQPAVEDAARHVYQALPPFGSNSLSSTEPTSA